MPLEALRFYFLKISKNNMVDKQTGNVGATLAPHFYILKLCTGINAGKTRNLFL
jgi:hypothetical protein